MLACSWHAFLVLLITATILTLLGDSATLKDYQDMTPRNKRHGSESSPNVLQVLAPVNSSRSYGDENQNAYASIMSWDSLDQLEDLIGELLNDARVSPIYGMPADIIRYRGIATLIVTHTYVSLSEYKNWFDEEMEKLTAIHPPRLKESYSNTISI